jgi:tol-pal system protein YbgF
MRRTLVALSLSLGVGIGSVYADPALDETGDIDARVARLERMLQSQSLLELSNRIDALRAEVQELRGQLEEQSYTLSKLQAAGAGAAPAGTAAPSGVTVDVGGTPTPSEPLSDDALGLPVSGVEPAVVSVTPASGGVAVDAAPGVVSAAVDPAPTTDRAVEQAEYQAALDLALKKKDYLGAAESFRRFVEAHPASEYADNAQYWLGETQYVSGKFQEALADFQRVVDKYPDSTKLPDAMLKIGYIHYEQRHWDDARQAFAKLRETFPESTAARLAVTRLERMDRDGR